ncbi:MAG: hypothetical protein VW230_03925 [Candidatus Poseidoniales archaeon]
MEDVVWTEHFEPIHLGPQKFGIVLLLFSWSLLPFGLAMLTFLFQDFMEFQNFLLFLGLALNLVALFLASEKTPHRILSLSNQWRFALFFSSISMLFTLAFQSIWPSSPNETAAYWWLPLTFGTASLFPTFVALRTGSTSSRIVYDLPCSYESKLDFSDELNWIVESAVFRHGIIAYLKPDWETVFAVVGYSSNNIPPSALIRCILVSSKSIDEARDALGIIQFSMSVVGQSMHSGDEES